MNSFVGQDGTIVFHYPTYPVHAVAPFAPQPRIRPNSRIYLFAHGPKGLELHRGNWGMGTGRFDWNARDDRLDESPLWKRLWATPSGRCIIPASRVYEATTRYGPRQWHAIRRLDERPMLIAGLGRIQEGKHRTEWHASMVTVDSGPVFSAVHDRPREVVCLRDWDEAMEWVSSTDTQRLRRLLRAAGPELLTSYRVHDDVLKESFPEHRCAAPWSGGQTTL